MDGWMDGGMEGCPPSTPNLALLYLSVVCGWLRAHRSLKRPVHMMNFLPDGSINPDRLVKRKPRRKVSG